MSRRGRAIGAAVYIWSPILFTRFFLQLRDGLGFESGMNQLVNLQSGNFSFQMPYSQNLIVPP